MGTACRESLLISPHVGPATCTCLHSNTDEQTELDALRVENDTLRRNLGRLEEKVKRAEDTVLHQQEQTQTLHEADHKQLEHTQCNVDGQGSGATQGRSAPIEVCHLHGILQWLHVST